ncbi:hypothetical protein [Kineosporia sp. R_H_3]|uniref:hypothetical protein n=1 Tax=Kineosporia sp. R_H_3 TaxID=1961848 RepID=UPI000B4B3362|nr:hypothetical protein [Kineosporia sp. R_H_3]
MSDERIVDAMEPLPDPALEPTAALLRDALAREAAAITPSADGLARIRAAIEAEQGTASSGVRRLVALPGRSGRSGRAGRSGRDGGRRSWVSVLAAAAAVVVLAGAGGFALDRFPIFTGKTEAPAAGEGGDGTTSVNTAPVPRLPVYVVGELERGKRVEYRLFREYRPTTAVGISERLSDALTEAVSRRPDDADYVRVFGGAGSSKVDARWDEAKGEVVVALTPAMTTVRLATDSRATIAIQQLVWTASAVVGRPDVPVRITVKGPAVNTYLFGRPNFELGGVFRRQHSVDDPLAPVWLVDPEDGTTMGRALTRFGVSAGYDARDGVTWTLRRNDKKIAAGTAVVGFTGGREAAVPGSRGTARIDVDHTQPGFYELVVSIPGPAGEPAWTDSKTFTVN